LSVEAKLLNRLKAAQQDFAVDALRQPQTRDAFEYGYRVGIFTGYEAAIAVLLKILNEEQHSDNDL
jgi:hypothetical protein|tara:strand:- start:176 stop:373 length:198 start_codon:yes stop_codon:yes gene_type:complete